MINEQLRIVDSLRPYSDLPDNVWQEVRKEIERVGLEGANQSARRQVATAMLKARVAKGDYEGHPFRGNQWSDSTGASSDGSGASGQIKESLGKLGNAAKRLVKREPAVKVKDIKEAIKLMQAGKNVELESDEDVNTLLEELNIQANQAKERGEKFKINLCNVSVAGSNLFCGQSLADDDGKPLPRIKMPQLSGSAREGSEAAKIANDKGEADAGPAFLKFLEEGGIKVKSEKVNAAKLKASQAELIGAKVAGIMSKKKWDEGTIYISKDNYVIDGHHRWAAAVGADSKDGLGDLKVKVVRVDMNISEVLQVANDFTDEFGIEKVSA
jgi:hypothetical protein